MSQPTSSPHYAGAPAGRRFGFYGSPVVPSLLFRFALPLLTGLLAAAPLWGPGIVNTRGGGDSPFLLVRTMEMAELLAHGIFPPRWMSHAAYGLGYPFFNHYASLPYFISGGLLALGLNVLAAIQATQTLGFLLAALAMAHWARAIFRSEAARALSVVAYTFAPFHLVNVYVRGDSLSEFYAFIWFPLILWAVDRAAAACRAAADSRGAATRAAAARRVVGAVLAGALAYGALILTHNISALIFSPFALFYALAALRRHRLGQTRMPTEAPTGCEEPRGPGASDTAPPRWRSGGLRLAVVLTPFVLGILLTAWFWLPAIAETRYGQMGPAFTEGYFHYSNHFRALNLTQRSLAFDYSVAGTMEGAGPFTMGLVQTLLATTGCVVLIAQLARAARATSLHALPIRPFTHLVALLVSTLMITPLSTPLWEHLPLLALTQFPWRFLSVQALFTATVTGAIFDHPLPSPSRARVRTRGGTGKGLRWTLAALAAALTIAAALSALQPERLAIGPSDVTWERLSLYEAFTGNIGTTIRYEYLPADVVPRLYISEVVVDGEGALRAAGEGLRGGHLVQRTPDMQSWQVETVATQTSVAFPLNWWPGWRAYLDGTEVPSYAMEGSGRLTVDLPAGSHTVTLRLRPTALQTMATALSLTSALIAGAAGYALTRPSRGALNLPRVSLGAGGIAVVLCAALLGPLFVRHPLKGHATFFDFERIPYPHRGPVAFADGALTSIRQSAFSGQPGGAVTLELEWEMLPTELDTVTLRAVSPAEPRHGVDYVIAQTSAPSATADRLELALPDDLSRGLILLQLRLTDVDGKEIPASTPDGQTTGPLYVGWLRVPEGAPLGRVEPLAQFEDLQLVALGHEQQTTSLRLKLTWSLDPHASQTSGGTPRNWRLSLRVLDLAGRLLSQQDLQPGYGYLPTTLWQPEERVVDVVTLPLPEGLAPGEYTLRIVTYLQATMRGGGEVDLPLQLDLPTLFDLRDACCELDRRGALILCQSAEIALLSLDRPESLQEGEPLRMTAEWNAMLPPTEDLQATWAVIDPHGDQVATITGPLAVGSGTSEWPRHTWVRSPVTLDLPQRMTEGAHAIKLILTGESSGAVACGEVATLTVTPRPRTLRAPEMAYTEGTTFGDALLLLGYDLTPPQRRGDEQHQTTLTLWWQALEAPERDYKRFVHLYDPGTEAVLAQDDAMPRNWSYPTTLWMAGEVVSDTVTLDLSGVPEGTYHLGVGWYDPETLDRLPATASEQNRVTSDRVALDPSITVGR